MNKHTIIMYLFETNTFIEKGSTDMKNREIRRNMKK